MLAEIERVLWIALGGLVAASVGYFGGYFNERARTTRRVSPGMVRFG